MVSTLEDKVALITPEGKLMGGPETATLCQEVEKLDRAGYRKVVLDLSRVRWANSTAIGALIKCFLTLQSHGAELRLACLSERVRHYMTITKLNQVMPTFESVEQALTSPSPA
ncbi:MAG: STAS domain-containing protein [bacterium]|nr:STAS domain-containing protein [candidate division KSB1 bacterium]MDH7560779.1 STAS domain-containing protein [bacterium]